MKRPFKKHHGCWNISLITLKHKKCVKEDPNTLANVPNHFKTQKICEKGVGKGPWYLYHFPDHFKTRKMCKKAVKKYPWLVPDWFVNHQQIEIWHGHCNHCNNNKLI